MANHFQGTTLIKPAHPKNFTDGRQGSTISEITIHHMAGNMSVDALGDLWQKPDRAGSSHYGVNGTDVGLYVSEKDTAWCNSDFAANKRAITIETANDGGAPDWHVSNTTLATLIDLVADLAKRHNLGILKVGKNLTYHSMYTATACPGPYLFGKLEYIAASANAINFPEPTKPEVDKPFFLDCIIPLVEDHWEEYKLLPSVAVAQSILESGWGQSELAQQANNMFGIKADKNWTGEVYTIKTNEVVNGETIVITADFKKYSSTRACIQDRALKLISQPRYADIVGCRDYKEACTILQEAGWATALNYAERLIDIIETHSLAEIDILPEPEPEPEVPTPEPEETDTLKDLLIQLIEIVLRLINVVFKRGD